MCVCACVRVCVWKYDLYMNNHLCGDDPFRCPHTPAPHTSKHSKPCRTPGRGHAVSTPDCPGSAQTMIEWSSASLREALERDGGERADGRDHPASKAKQTTEDGKPSESVGESFRRC